MCGHRKLRALVVCVAMTLGFSSAAVLPAHVASAQSGKKASKGAKKPVAVGLIEGPQGEPTRRHVLTALKETNDYEVTDAEDLRPGSGKAAYAAMASALQVEAIVVGKVSRNLDLTLSVIGPDGTLIEDVKLKGGSAKGLEKAIDNELEIVIADSLGKKKAAKVEEKPKSKPKPKPEPKPEPEDSEPEDEEDAEPGDEEKPAKETEPPPEPTQAGLRPLELLVGARLYNRKFNYADLHSTTVFPYNLALAPAIIASLRVYPFAFFQDGALANLGIMGKFEFGIATSTNYSQPQPDGSAIVTPLKTGTSEWQVGLRGRLPLGRHELGIFGQYGAHSFVLNGDEGPTAALPQRPYPLVPDVDYHYLRFGIDGRFRVSKLTVGAHLAPRFLVSMKQIDLEDYWFPGATGSGLDFGLFGAYQVLSFLDVAAGIDYLRYGFDFNNIPDNASCRGLNPANGCNDTSRAPIIAGGATDTYMSFWAGLMLHFDASASSGDGSVSVKAGSGDD